MPLTRTEKLRDVFPIDEVIEERLEVVGTSVAVVDVVGVLPNVATEDRLGAIYQRLFAIRGLGHDDLAVLDGEPSPARAELGDACLDEVLLHFGDRAKIGDDLLFKLARNLVAAAARLHPLPEMQVIVVLAGIVEESGVLAKGTLDDILERFALPLGAFEQIVGVVDVSEVMFVVVIFKRFARHVRGKRLMRIGQIGQRKRHREFSSSWVSITVKATDRPKVQTVRRSSLGRAGQGGNRAGAQP